MQVIKVTASGVVRTGKTGVQGVTLVAGADAAAITLQDTLTGATATKDKGGAKALANTSQDSAMYGNQFDKGVYATLTGTNPVAYVYIE